jgi:hypothetical protein
MLLAAAIFITMVDDRMPRVNVDEGYLLGEELYLRGEYDPPFFNPGYPPLMRGLFALGAAGGALVTGRPPLESATEVILGLRLISVVFNLLNTTLIGWLVRRAAGDAFALLAMLIWVLIPEPLYYALLAESEVYQAFFALLTLAACSLAVERTSDRWLVAAAVCACLMFVAKYSAFPIFAVPLAAAAWLRWRQWGRLARVWCVQLLVYGLTAVLIFGVYGAGSLAESSNKETPMFFSTGASALLDVPRAAGMLAFQADYLNLEPVVFWGLLALCLVTALAAAWRQPQALVVLAAWALAVGIAWLIVAYLYFPALLARYSLPAAPLYVVAFVGGAGLAAHLAARRVGQAAVWLGWLALALLWLPQNGWAMQHAIQEHGKVVTEQVIADHSARAFPGGTFFAHPDMPEYFHPIMGGYDGPPRAWIDKRELLALPPEEWRSNYTGFVMLTDAEYAALGAGQPFLTQVWRVPNALFPVTRGDAQTVYWIGRPADRHDALLGDSIVLLATEQRPTPAALHLRFFWSLRAPIPRDLALYVHLTPADSRDVLSQVDGSPGVVTYPTSAWQPDETIISEEMALPLPADLPAGTYRVLAGLYDGTGRLHTPEGDDFAEIARITIP